MYYEWHTYVLHILKTFRWGQLLRDVSLHFRCHRELPLWRGLGNRFRRRHAAVDARHPDWIRPEMLQLAADEDAGRENARMVHPFHPVAHGGLTGPLWNSLFEGFDAGCTRSPVEVRHPYMDVRLIRYLLVVPLIPWCRDKYLLRRAFQGLLPDAVLQRPKTPLHVDPDTGVCSRQTGLPQWVPEPEIEPVCRSGCGEGCS